MFGKKKVGVVNFVSPWGRVPIPKKGDAFYDSLAGGSSAPFTRVSNTPVPDESFFYKTSNVRRCTPKERQDFTDTKVATVILEHAHFKLYEKEDEDKEKHYYAVSGDLVLELTSAEAEIIKTNSLEQVKCAQYFLFQFDPALFLSDKNPYIWTKEVGQIQFSGVSYWIYGRSDVNDVIPSHERNLMTPTIYYAVDIDGRGFAIQGAIVESVSHGREPLGKFYILDSQCLEKNKGQVDLSGKPKEQLVTFFKEKCQNEKKEEEARIKKAQEKKSEENENNCFDHIVSSEATINFISHIKELQNDSNKNKIIKEEARAKGNKLSEMTFNLNYKRNNQCDAFWTSNRALIFAARIFMMLEGPEKSKDSNAYKYFKPRKIYGISFFNASSPEGTKGYELCQKLAEALKQQGYIYNPSSKMVTHSTLGTMSTTDKRVTESKASLNDGKNELEGSINETVPLLKS